MAASQQFKPELVESKYAEQEDTGTAANRWGSPKTTTQLDNIWRECIPQTTTSKLTGVCHSGLSGHPTAERRSWSKHCPIAVSHFPIVHFAGSSNFTVNFNITKE